MAARRDRRVELGVLLLIQQLFEGGAPPPVTLVAVLVQAAVYLGFVPFLDLDQIGSMCLHPRRVLLDGEWWRLLAPVIMHADDMHLYYNMVSLLYKGRRLEPRLGSLHFALMLFGFALTTTVTTIALSIGADALFPREGYMSQCAVGFSGVLFALKVVHTSYFPEGDAQIFGWLPVPSRYVCWVELIFIQLLTPNASFLGHLAGILVGLVYLAEPWKVVTNAFERAQEGRIFAGSGSPIGGRTGYRRDGVAPGFQETPRNPFNYRDYNEYTGGRSEDEQFEAALRAPRRRHDDVVPTAGATEREDFRLP